MRSITPPRARVTFEDEDSGAVSPSIGADPAKPDALVPETLEADATIDVSRADWDADGTLPLSLDEKPAQYAQSSGGSGSRESDDAGAESEDDDSDDDDDSLAAGCLLPTQRQDGIDDSDDSDNEENDDGDEGERRDVTVDREAQAGAEQPRGAAPSPAGERAAATSKSTESPDTSAALVSTLSSLKELRQQISADDAAHQREEVDINQRIDELIAERAAKQRRWDEREKDLKEQESSMVRTQPLCLLWPVRA